MGMTLQLFLEDGTPTTLQRGDMIIVEKFRGNKKNKAEILISLGRGGARLWPGRQSKDSDNKIYLCPRSVSLPVIYDLVATMLCHVLRHGARATLIDNRRDRTRFQVVS